MNTAQDTIARILVTKFSVDEENIAPAATLAALDLDSLAVLELFDTLQGEFGVTIDEAETSEDMTVAELAAYVTERLPGAARAAEAS
ncbi:acyl carrier protein [Streptomyces indicus]|uniref:Acyl carrier protein n=1 Tax=Streptomyces indicus TaxID=417292 RepID=A0A1G9AX54_9ACTN|nr:acyl carrier protein [Streptomyces indicus]SDK31300.1 acyl carrier protein [Streptomyces indicus]